MFKFSLMRVRAKLSYYAFQKRRTINEHVLYQIQRSYNELTNTKQIPQIAPYPPELIQEFDEILNAPLCQTIQLMMDLTLKPQIYKRKMDIYKKRELEQFGVSKESELTLEQRELYQQIIDRNVVKHEDFTK